MKLELTQKIKESKGTETFVFKPEKEVEYLPGQFFYITLPRLNYPDSRGATRHFTISSSPTENGVLKVTTRIRDESGYKQTLNKLPIGEIVEGEGPNGTFVLEEDVSTPNVFLAGGIGITPFRSMIKYISDKKLDIPVYLIYSNSNEEDVTFKKELDKISNESGNVKIKHIITSKEGRLDEIKLKEILKEWGLEIGKTNFWIVGPPPMVDAVEAILEGINVSSSSIRTEKFTGY